MKKIVHITVSALLLASVFCGCAQKEKPVITIDDIEITRNEFEEAFETWEYKAEPATKRSDFLEMLITRKLILKEAVRLGLDKNPEFLKSIQFFWEQSLLKLALAQKSRQLEATSQISEKEINDYYIRIKESGLTDKTLPEIHSKIKWILYSRKQTQAMQDWVQSLRANARIHIDYTRLGIEDK